MSKPDYFDKYRFDWEMLDVVIGGKSALDANHFFGADFNPDSVERFLRGYGVSSNEPISKAELFGNFQESIQFIKRYFLSDGNKEDGLNLKVPNSILMVTGVEELFQKVIESDVEKEALWAEVVLKVMHTILHIDKDLRSKYFSTIQTQILDNYYRFISRDKDNQLQLGGGNNAIALVEFDTKTKKTRDSVILKLLHKAEHVAEELFDRVGIRFVTKSRLDCIRVVEFLIEKGVVIPHNIKPSRSINNLINLHDLKQEFHSAEKIAQQTSLTERSFLDSVEMAIMEGQSHGIETRNNHSLNSYRSVQITARQLIKYEDPFVTDFLKVKRFIAENDVSEEVRKKINGLDVSTLTKDVEFFYPYEIQVVDEVTNENNKKGDASHSEYKRIQLVSARDRLFRKLINVSADEF